MMTGITMQKIIKNCLYLHWLGWYMVLALYLFIIKLRFYQFKRNILLTIAHSLSRWKIASLHWSVWEKGKCWKVFWQDVRGLDKEMRCWDAFNGLEVTVKNMLTSLRAVGELQNPAIRDRHWQQLVVATRYIQFKKLPKYILKGPYIQF